MGAVGFSVFVFWWGFLFVSCLLVCLFVCLNALSVCLFARLFYFICFITCYQSLMKDCIQS